MIMLAIATTAVDAALAPAIIGLGFAGMAYYMFWLYRWL